MCLRVAVAAAGAAAAAAVASACAGGRARVYLFDGGCVRLRADAFAVRGLSAARGITHVAVGCGSSQVRVLADMPVRPLPRPSTPSRHCAPLA